jgi:opacity protein-like surface antigen
MQLIFAPGTVIYYVGDNAAVSATLGIPVEPAAANVQPVKIGPFTSGAINLNEWYANGASGTITYQYTPEE